MTAIKLTRGIDFHITWTQDNVKVRNSKNCQKFKFSIFHLANKICKYILDPAGLVEDAEQTCFCPQTDCRTRSKQYTPTSHPHPHPRRGYIGCALGCILVDIERKILVGVLDIRMCEFKLRRITLIRVRYLCL